MIRFAVMLQSEHEPIPGLPLYGFVNVPHDLHDRSEACAFAEAEALRTGKHVRVVVCGHNYDTADYGPRPKRYTPHSSVARLVRGVPCAPRERAS